MSRRVWLSWLYRSIVAVSHRGVGSDGFDYEPTETLPRPPAVECGIAKDVGMEAGSERGAPPWLPGCDNPSPPQPFHAVKSPYSHSSFIQPWLLVRTMELLQFPHELARTFFLRRTLPLDPAYSWRSKVFFFFSFLLSHITISNGVGTITSLNLLLSHTPLDAAYHQQKTQKMSPASGEPYFTYSPILSP